MKKSTTSAAVIAATILEDAWQEVGASVERFTSGPEVACRFLLDDATSVEPHSSLTGIWTFAHPDTLAVGTTLVSPGEFHAKAEAGVLVQMPHGTGSGRRWNITASPHGPLMPSPARAESAHTVSA